MNVDDLPGILHFDICTEVSLEDLSQKVLELFPKITNESIEEKNDTLYLYDPSESINFIHISQQRVGIVFAPEVVNSNGIEHAWISIDAILKVLLVKKISKLHWQLRLVRPFKTKGERDLVTERLSPFKGYKVGSLTLFPKQKKNFYICLGTAKKKQKKEYGILLDYNFELPNVKSDDILVNLKNFAKIFNNHKNTKAIIERIL